MGMPINSENRRQIAADGTIFEVLDDGTIKRIGKLSDDGKFEPFETPKNWNCPRCGTENESEDNFCGKCGTMKPDARTTFENRNMTRSVPVIEEDDEDDKIQEDKASNQFLAASFCVPIIGLILGIYCLAKGKPKSGIACLMAGAASFTLISVLTNMF